MNPGHLLAYLRPKGWRLQFSIGAIFAVLVTPSIAGLIYWSYDSSLALISQYAERDVRNAAEDARNTIAAPLRRFADSVLIAAQVEAAMPGFLRGPDSDRMMIQELRNSPGLTSFYIGFADGSFRQMLRVAPGARVSGITPPAETRFASRMIDRSSGDAPLDRYVFLDAEARLLGDDSAGPTTYDARQRAFWRHAEQVRSDRAQPTVAIADPYVIGSAGKLGVSVSAPVMRDGRLVAAVATNFTLDRVSQYLQAHPASANATTLVVSRDGTVIVHPDPAEMVDRKGQEIVSRRVGDISNAAVRAAFARRSELRSDHFTFTALSDGAEYVALFVPFLAEFGKPWEIVIVAPTDDFIGPLRRNNRLMAAVGTAMIVVLLLLISGFARLISRPLVGLVREIHAIETFALGGEVRLSSNIREVKQLIGATQVMKTALRAFTAYVPREVVRGLLLSGRPIELGGRSAHLTVMFTDLEAFSTLAERTPARALLDQVSTYLGMMTRAVNETSGSVDKFIGDSVMAFWGAPLADDDHAYHACVAAVHGKRRLAAQNALWQEAGLPELRMRVGIHSDAVLVGNVGSMERMSYTVMGDGVNIAARLEGINKQFGTSICVSHSVFRECGERLWLRPIDEVPVKGRRGDILVYELMGIRDGESDLAASQHEQDLCRRTTEAHALMAGGDLVAAARAYDDIARVFDDPLAVAMARRCREGRTDTRVVEIAESTKIQTG
jgi:adenylate cyclase